MSGDAKWGGRPTALEISWNVLVTPGDVFVMICTKLGVREDRQMVPAVNAKTTHLERSTTTSSWGPQFY